MKHLLFFLFFFFFSFSQNSSVLPKNITPEEKKELKPYFNSFNSKINSDIFTSPPDFSVRTMAEWEEIQALTIAWEGFEPILTEIVRNSVEECKVIIACDNPSSVNSYLLANNVNTENVEYLNVSTNSIWMRDYGQNTVYKNDVDSIYLVDWIYNRPRPSDDVFPEALSDFLNINLYQTSESPYQIVATGGNFMSDGFGTAFSSNLVLDENDGTGPYGGVFYPNHSEDEIDNIMNQFMGINNYIKMEELPFDAIHHIDMHMKLLNEETLLVAEYPEGISDGPQIEENLQYILDNFTTKYGTPFKVIRIPSPPSTSGAYPGSQPGNQTDGYYRTYTNSVFVNKTVLVPFYREEYDTIAQRIYEEALPGYNIVGIDCDNSGNNIISLSGAIHCITHSVGVNDPLLISFKQIDDTCVDESPYVGFQTLVKHKSGISEVNFNYRIEGESNFSSVSMQNNSGDNWDVTMTFDDLSTIEYYVSAISNSGKEQVRPMTAPGGFYSFKYEQCEFEDILGCTDSTACNFSITANINDGSCIYPEQYFDCSGNCLNDIDDDGVCDELEIVGCTDDTACNYDPNATENGSCIYPDQYYDCSGNCLNDTDGDGICDELELLDCSLSNGQIVQSGWSGFDNGLNYCNSCFCEDGILSCTEIACDPCFAMPEEGDCDAAFIRYYFNQETETCDSFIWGGCGGVVPFETLEDCQYFCGDNSNITDIDNQVVKVIKVVNILGQNVVPSSNSTIFLYIYDDGSVKKIHKPKI